MWKTHIWVIIGIGRCGKTIIVRPLYHVLLFYLFPYWIPKSISTKTRVILEKKGKNLVCVFIFQMCGKWSVSRGTTIASSIFILFLKSDIGMQILAEEINILKKKIAKLNFGIQSRQWWWWPTTNKKRFFANFIMMIRMDPTIAKIVQASYC